MSKIILIKHKVINVSYEHSEESKIVESINTQSSFKCRWRRISPIFVF